MSKCKKWKDRYQIRDFGTIKLSSSRHHFQTKIPKAKAPGILVDLKEKSLY